MPLLSWLAYAITANGVYYYLLVPPLAQGDGRIFKGGPIFGDHSIISTISVLVHNNVRDPWLQISGCKSVVANQ